MAKKTRLVIYALTGQVKRVRIKDSDPKPPVYMTLPNPGERQWQPPASPTAQPPATTTYPTMDNQASPPSASTT